MSKRDQDYNLIAALHDQLEDVERYEQYLKDAAECEQCTDLWERLKRQTEEAITLIRQEIQNHVGS